ncbi:Uncharacterized protein Fot_00052 [Forsythia ovata]|uniref:Uncharacterized protein n=1 Tax=Forsythia ovata TaxID=205694 RepID=A0ABD1X029_9LAMI
MDDLHMVSISPVCPLKTDEQKKAHRRPVVGSDCLLKSINTRSFPRSHFMRQSCKVGFTNNTNKWRLHVDSSSQNTFNSGATDGSAEVCKGDKAAERNSRKKTRKRGKRNRNLLGCKVLTEHGYVNGKSTSISDIAYSFGPCVYETGLAVSPPVPCCNSDSHQPKNNDIINGSATTKTLTSYENMVETSEASIPSSPQNFSIVSHASHCNDGLKNFNGERQNINSKSIRSLDYPCYAKMNDSLVLDFLSLGLKCEESCPENYFKLCYEKNNDADITELPHYIVSEDMLIGNTEHCDNAESINIFRKDSNGERNLHTLGMREKHLRKVPKNFNIFRRNSFRNLNKHSGKENSNSIWQKVQRDEGEYNPKFGKVNSVCSEIFDETKQGPVQKRDCNFAECYMLTKPENKNQAQLKIPGKLKRKMSSGSKKEYISHCWKASHAVKTSSNLYSKTNMQQNEFLDYAQISQRKGNGVSDAHSSTWSPRIGHHPKKVDTRTFKHIHYTEMSSTNLEASDRASIAVSDLKDQPAENQANLLFNSCYPPGPSELHKALSALSLHAHVDDENAKREKEVPVAVSSRQDDDPAAVIEERKSIGVGETNIPGLSCDSLSIGELHKLAGKSWSPEVIAEERSASNPSPLVSSENVGVTYNGQSSENINNLPFGYENQVQKSMDKSTGLPAERSNNHAGATCLTPEIRSPINFYSENDSNDIFLAVNGAHWSQICSEAIEMAAGCPIAEFERFLHSASPVLCPSHDVLSCQTSKPEQVAGTSVCRDKMLNISLGNLWQWYEKPGSYGLEVIAEDCEDAKKLGIDCFEFRAYFVPSLSAVQLFRRCTPCPTGNSDMMTETVTGEPQEIDETVRSAGATLLPIFPILVPQPHTENKTVLPPQNHVSVSKPPSSCIKENEISQPVGSKLSDDIELLFEYFECEQPQQRRPLYEMIKELVRGEGCSKCRAHGDPNVLERAGLQDLHQSSWYSVAWYPIYRIPDGTLRAAFLTYHSLGHLVRRNPIYDSSVDTCIVSPVVGLQSYNAQGECWFRPRLPEKILTANNPGILKERLRTLEQTASLMARAVIMRGGQAFVNRQPDYEFFLSRRT